MTATTATISPWPLVRKGDQQHPVKTLQYLLRARGHNLTVDGIFGPNTDAAVRAFQQQKGLAVDGIVGPNTWSTLIITVKQGSQGDAVRGVQEEFQFRNLSGDPSKGLQVDGIFGPKTDAAVRGFQQALHQDIPSVTVDGIVGPVTWRAPPQPSTEHPDNLEQSGTATGGMVRRACAVTVARGITLRYGPLAAPLVCDAGHGNVCRGSFLFLVGTQDARRAS